MRNLDSERGSMGNAKIDISNFRLADDDPLCHYVFAVIIKTPTWDFQYETRWQRFVGWILGQKTRYTYFHVGQIVLCDTDENMASPRETPWGAKPGKHDCTVENFTDLAETIQFARDVVNGDISHV